MKKLGILFLVFGLFFASDISAIDYSANESYYQKLCRKQSSYNANKATCQGYENYLKETSKAIKENTKNIEEQIAATKDDISKLIVLIKENEILIEKKKNQIEKTKIDIKETEKEIVELEKEVMSRLALMQEISGENFVVDFLMDSVNLEDFIVKIDGINAINDSNNEVINDLEYARKQLKEKEKKLSEEKDALNESQKKQNQMLKEYRSKEAELFIKLEEEHRKRSVYNTKLNNINIKGVANSKGFIRPTSGIVTAVAWYYPASFGGGWHPGLDIGNGTGTPIKAPASGVVLATGNGMGYGNFMITAHQVGNSTYTFIYGHLNGYASFGSSIKQGQTIAYMGNTGNSTGPHLHIEVFKHSGKSLSSVVNTYRSNGDLYFGLGYGSVGSCSNTCRLKPQSFFNTSYGSGF